MLMRIPSSDELYIVQGTRERGAEGLPAPEPHCMSSVSSGIIPRHDRPVLPSSLIDLILKKGTRYAASGMRGRAFRLRVGALPRIEVRTNTSAELL